MPRNNLIQVRRDTAANWTSANPTLASGEIGLETDTGRYKIGNGTTPWNSLQINLEVDNLTVGGDINVDNLVASGDVELDGNVTANSVIALDSGVFVGPVSVGDTLSVGGVSSLNDDLYVNGLAYSDEVQAGNSIRLDNKYLTPYTGFRNKIINGSFEIWQRGTSRTFMQAGQYLADRWTVRLYQQNAHQRTNVTQESAEMQTRYALRSSSSTTAEVAGGTRMWTNTELESADSIPLRGKTMTLSFWVRFSSATCSSSTATPYGNWSGSIEWCTSTTDGPMATTAIDGGGGGVTLTNGSLPTTWTKYTATTTIPSNVNNVALFFGFAGLGNTASANTVWYEITQVQLEEGSVATPFEQRPVGTELALCQRYYYSEGDAAIPMYPDQNGTGSRNRYFAVQFPVTMRTEGTASGYTGTGTPSVYYITPNNCVFYKQSSTNTLGVDLYSWTIDAEL